MNLSDDSLSLDASLPVIDWTQNEYLRDFQSLSKLSRKPEADPIHASLGISDPELSLFLKRDFCIDKYGLAIPTAEALSVLADSAPILEIGAGKGYWAYLLRSHGVPVVCYDADPPSDPWTEVLLGTHEMASKYPDHTLFLCWPPYDTSMAYECLRRYQGDKLIYIGEGRGGANGDERFHALLERDWNRDKALSIPQWPMIHDYLAVFTRKK